MSTAKTLDSSQFCDIGATPAGGGSSTINHGGDFDAKAGQTVSCTKKTGGN